MAMQLSTARKLTLKVRIFLRKYGIPLLGGTRTRCKGGIPEPKNASVEGFKTTSLPDPYKLVGGDKVGQYGRTDHVK